MWLCSSSTSIIEDRDLSAHLNILTIRQAAARRLFCRLVRVAPEVAWEGTRQRTALSSDDKIARNVANKLANAFILVIGSEGSTGTLWVELAHEAFIHHWERLRAWLNEDREFLLWRQHLQVQVEAWMRHAQDIGYLLRGPALSEGEVWLRGRPEDLTPAEQHLIRESIVLRERSQSFSRLVRTFGFTTLARPGLRDCTIRIRAAERRIQTPNRAESTG
jgi:hypothetical protein